MMISPVWNPLPGQRKLRCGLMAALGCLALAVNPTPGLSQGAQPEFQAGARTPGFAVSTDPACSRAGQPSQCLASTVPEPQGYGSIRQTSPAAPFLGQRVRLSGWVKATGVQGWTGLWLQVEGPETKTLAFADSATQAISGTRDWKQVSLVLDVPAQAQTLSFGLLLTGAGRAWLNDLKLEPVAASVPVTEAGGSLQRPLEVTVSARNWHVSGSRPQDYRWSEDPAQLRQGEPAQLLASTSQHGLGFGTLMQNVPSARLLGKRVRFSAWVKTEQVEAWSGLWMRVDGPSGRPVAFDNMNLRPIRGNTDWQRYQVVLDVAADASQLALGVLLHGRGKVWLSEPTLEWVDAKVAVTSGPRPPF